MKLTVDDREPLRDADLRRGETDALRGVHRLEHLVDQLLELRVEDGHRRAGLRQHRIGILHDLVNLVLCHVSTLVSVRNSH